MEKTMLKKLRFTATIMKTSLLLRPPIFGPKVNLAI